LEDVLLTSRIVVRAFVLALSLVFSGCPIDPGPVDGGSPDAGSQAHRAPDALRACAATPGPVSSISQTTARLNQLPRPVYPACFVASLQRPINVLGSAGTLSLQPAVDRATPRVFIVNSTLVLSVVGGGDAGHFLEVGEWVTPLRTLKGEFALPITADLTADAPFTRIQVSSSGSTCGICHRGETASATVASGFDSAAFRPAPSDLVRVGELSAEHDGCVDAGTVSERCDMFHALFDFGEVRQGAFSNSVELFIP
jgi:hypothetical protein